jgi:uncharacterized protein (DUF608 family)
VAVRLATQVSLSDLSSTTDESWRSADWPVLKTYRGRQLDRFAMPLGGIGTGTVSLGGRGDLRDWEVVNRPAKGFVPRQAFFAIRAAGAGVAPFARCLEGPLTSGYEGWSGAPTPHAGLPRFTTATAHAAYPLAQVVLTEAGLPIDVRLEAWNPLVPTDAGRSGLPVAMLRVVVRNTADTPLEISVAGVLENFIGRDGAKGESIDNVNEFVDSDTLSGVLLRSDGVPTEAEQWGTMALTTATGDGVTVTRRRDWTDTNWNGPLLDFWDDFLADGDLDDRGPNGRLTPIATLCSKRTVEPGEEAVFPFQLTWHFPNRQNWEHGLTSADAVPQQTIGNWYTTQDADAWAVAQRVAAQTDSLETDTVDFVAGFCASPLPEVVKEAALFNVSTLRSQTVFRTPDGKMFGWEGCQDHSGSCHGSCTHVWNYEQATAYLFGGLARSMRDVEFLHATDANGLMSFRANLPLDYATTWGLAAADGQMGCLMKLYRDWKLSGDDDWLRQLWPSAKQNLAFCWIPGGWDADRDGVMEGCQHNTMDVEYYGPNPQMQYWYLGALRAMEELARHLGEDDYANDLHDLFERGSQWISANLFNGEYYEHQVWPPTGEIASGLRHPSMGALNLADPELQLGAGCLVDQLVGQYMAEVTGLGALGPEDETRTTLASIKRHNFLPSMAGHFNHMRSYALGPDEAATLMCSYPRGNRPERPFPYFTEVMTGFEYTLAVHMLYAGMVDDGLELIQAIRDRYDGERRSPFNEAECGHHYARAMASWAAVLALTGFDYQASSGAMKIDLVDGAAPTFWSTGDAWGTMAMNGERVDVVVRQGSLNLLSVAVSGGEPQPVSSGGVITAPASLTVA